MRAPQRNLTMHFRLIASAAEALAAAQQALHGASLECLSRTPAAARSRMPKTFQLNVDVGATEKVQFGERQRAGAAGVDSSSSGLTWAWLRTRAVGAGQATLVDRAAR